jgi:hypothetical protein
VLYKCNSSPTYRGGSLLAILDKAQSIYGYSASGYQQPLLFLLKKINKRVIDMYAKKQAASDQKHSEKCGYYYCDVCGGGWLNRAERPYYCPFCQANHVHGWAEILRKDGHKLPSWVP